MLKAVISFWAHKFRPTLCVCSLALCKIHTNWHWVLTQGASCEVRVCVGEGINCWVACGPAEGIHR